MSWGARQPTPRKKCVKGVPGTPNTPEAALYGDRIGVVGFPEDPTRFGGGPSLRRALSKR